jgi:hypothetical protein
MGVAPHRPDSIGPAEGKSLVLVVRPHAYFGKAIGTSLYDGDEFVGLLTDNAVVAHQAEPGKHVFMLLSGQPAAAAFLEGELLGGTTYLIEVAPRSSWTRPPFHLIPVNPNRRGAGVDKTLSTGSLLVMNEQARRWDQENHTSVMRK